MKTLIALAAVAVTMASAAQAAVVSTVVGTGRTIQQNGAAGHDNNTITWNFTAPDGFKIIGYQATGSYGWAIGPGTNNYIVLLHGTIGFGKYSNAGSVNSGGRAFTDNLGATATSYFYDVGMFRGFAGDQVFIDPTVTAFTVAVPEPASWAMLVMGFGVAGAALRIRRRKLLSV